jgi:hypothetical protein
MTAATLANGTKIGAAADIDSPEPVYNAIVEVLSIGAIGYSTETIEVTNLDSLSKEYISGLSDGVSFTIEFNWVTGDTYQEALRTAVADGTTYTFLIEWADSPMTKCAFLATPESFEIGAESGSQITASCSFKITGTLDWVASGLAIV